MTMLQQVELGTELADTCSFTEANTIVHDDWPTSSIIPIITWFENALQNQ